MPNVVRFVLDTARNLYVPGVGQFHAGVLDVDANNLAAVARSRYLLQPYRAVELGIVASTTPPPNLPAAPGSVTPTPDPYPQYLTMDEIVASPALRAVYGRVGYVVVDGHDQAALVAAVAKLPLDGGHLHLPGTDDYVVSAGTTLAGYSNLRITSDGARIIAAASWADTFYNSFPNYGKDSIFRLMDCVGVEITGLHIDGNIAQRTPYGPFESFNSNILVSACEDVAIHHCTLIGAMTDNITVMGDATTERVSRFVRVHDNVMKEARRNNMSLVGHDGLWIERNDISRAGKVKGISPMANIQCEPDYLNHSKNLHVVGNELYDNAGEYSMSISGRGTQSAIVADNTIRNSPGKGLNVSSLTADTQNTGIIVRGNRLLNNGESGFTTGRANVALFEGNVVVGNKYGFTSSIAGDVDIVGNVFAGNTYQGVVLTDFVSARLVGNRFEDNSSAQGLTDGAGFAVYATPASTASVFTFDGNTLDNAPGATSLMKGALVPSPCSARGNGNTGSNMPSPLLQGITGSGNFSFDNPLRQRATSGDANFDDQLHGGGRLLIGSKYHYAATAAPTTGTWEVGDVVYNKAPGLGKPVSWICLVAGTPGYWQPTNIMSAYGGDKGDATVTAQVGVQNPIIRFATTLTANRDLGLSTVGAYDGATFRVIRTAGGAFTLNVAGIKTLAQDQWVDVMYDGVAWRVTAYGSL